MWILIRKILLPISSKNLQQVEWKIDAIQLILKEQVDKEIQCGTDSSGSEIFVDSVVPYKDTDEFKRKILNVVILRCKRIVILKECYYFTNIGIG